MKKTYIRPASTVIALTTGQLLCVSGTKPTPPSMNDEVGDGEWNSNKQDPIWGDRAW